VKIDGDSEKVQLNSKSVCVMVIAKTDIFFTTRYKDIA
jgi:hypothetical protein